MRAINYHEIRNIAHIDESAKVANDGRKVIGRNSGNVINDARNLDRYKSGTSAEEEGAGEAADKKKTPNLIDVIIYLSITFSFSFSK